MWMWMPKSPPYASGKFVQRMKVDMWKKWKSRYVQSMAAWSKWDRTQKNVQVNDIILIKDEDWLLLSMAPGSCHQDIWGRRRTCTCRRTHLPQQDVQEVHRSSCATDRELTSLSSREYVQAGSAIMDLSVYRTNHVCLCLCITLMTMCILYVIVTS